MGLRDPIAVYNAATNIEAHLICSILTNAGIEAYASKDVSPGGLWMFGTLPEIHKPQVWANRSDIGRVKPLLDDYEGRLAARQAASEAMPDVTFPCEECGKSVTFPAQRRGHVETCPHCGNYVDVPEK
jgi:hypothetical protein